MRIRQPSQSPQILLNPTAESHRVSLTRLAVEEINLQSGQEGFSGSVIWQEQRESVAASRGGSRRIALTDLDFGEPL